MPRSTPTAPVRTHTHITLLLFGPLAFQIHWLHQLSVSFLCLPTIFITFLSPAGLSSPPLGIVVVILQSRAGLQDATVVASCTHCVKRPAGGSTSFVEGPLLLQETRVLHLQQKAVFPLFLSPTAAVGIAVGGSVCWRRTRKYLFDRRSSLQQETRVRLQQKISVPLSYCNRYSSRQCPQLAGGELTTECVCVSE